MRSLFAAGFTSLQSHSDIRGMVKSTGAKPLEIRYMSSHYKKSKDQSRPERTRTVMENLEPDGSTRFEKHTLIRHYSLSPQFISMKSRHELLVAGQGLQKCNHN